MKRVFRALLSVVIPLLLCGCNIFGQNCEEPFDIPATQFMTVGDLAFNNSNSQKCRIYLEENDILVPFIVLTSDYNGNCLLLREYLLDDFIFYNTTGEYGSYYCDSNVDNFLNQDYYYRLSEKIQRLIVMTEIEITSKKAIDTHVDEIETIMRNVFLLSANEVNASLSYIALKEGESLSYFKDNERRIATFSNLASGSWVLRTPALRDGNTVVGVADNGVIGIGGIKSVTGYSDSASRPAFCIPSETPIVKSDSAENVFILNDAYVDETLQDF